LPENSSTHINITECSPLHRKCVATLPSKFQCLKVGSNILQGIVVITSANHRIINSFIILWRKFTADCVGEKNYENP